MENRGGNSNQKNDQNKNQQKNARLRAEDQQHKQAQLARERDAKGMHHDQHIDDKGSREPTRR
jgi:hypothetical protein